MRWTARRTAAVAAVAAMVGLLPGSQTASAGVANMFWDCKVTTTHEVKIRAAISLLSPSATGFSVAPGRISLKITLPRAMYAELAGPDVTSLEGSTEPTVLGKLGSTERTLKWGRQLIPATPVPAAGDIRLTAASTSLPSERFTDTESPGTLSFTAKTLAMTLTPKPSGTTRQVVCMPSPDHSPLMGTVVVKDIVPGEHCPSPPASKDLNPAFPVPSNPPGAVQNPRPPTKAGCGLLQGHANVKKLGGAAAVTSLSSLWVNVAQYIHPQRNWARNDNVAVNEPVRATATFLTYGFVPTTTTVEMTQLGNANIHLIDTLKPADELLVTANAKVSLRVVEAKINGTPVEVGPDCITSKPVDLTLVGGEQYDPPYLDNITAGGVLRGTITIPPFSGCGVGEDLDPLLTASVSGEGNHIQLSQGPVCFKDGVACPPAVTINGVKRRAGKTNGETVLTK